LWGRKRPDNLVFSSTAISASRTSNGGSYAILGGGGGEKKQKGSGTFGGLPEEDEEFVQHKAIQTRHGIRKHAHPVSEVPYPISYEEVVLQGQLKLFNLVDEDIDNCSVSTLKNCSPWFSSKRHTISLLLTVFPSSRMFWTLVVDVATG
jgi:hypothetical protein